MIDRIVKVSIPNPFYDPDAEKNRDPKPKEFRIGQRIRVGKTSVYGRVTAHQTNGYVVFELDSGGSASMHSSYLTDSDLASGEPTADRTQPIPRKVVAGEPRRDIE